jgi:Zn-dependent protease with chaperone function
MTDQSSGGSGAGVNTGSFDFGRYVSARRAGVLGGDEETTRYAYSADVAMLRTFKRIRPVELAAAAVVRANKELMRNQLLGRTVRVSAQQFPRVHQLAVECAETLGVAVPTVYVANSPVINAYTSGTDDDAFIVIHSALIEAFEPAELKFVIGHETGHIQNKHVVYGTVLRLLLEGASLFLTWFAAPAQVPLMAWYRRAEITCDRAGLLCTRDLDAACRAFLKMAVGSRKLFEEMDVEVFVAQAKEGRVGVGRLMEAFDTHPYLPKRIEALRVFAESALYRTAMGIGTEGLTMQDVDSRTSAIVQIMKAGSGDEGGSRSGGNSEL